jgi:hypothetical protein
VCKLEDLIDKSPFMTLKELINKDDREGYNQFLLESLSPTIRNDKTISFTLWNLNVPGTIYSQANPSDIINGWRFLIDQNLPLRIYAKAFQVTSLLTLWLFYNPKDNVDVEEDTVINNILEPESLEILRLCYWINRCKQATKDRDSFETKLGEVRDTIKFQNKNEFEKQLNHLFTTFGRQGQNTSIPSEKKENRT